MASLCKVSATTSVAVLFGAAALSVCLRPAVLAIPAFEPGLPPPENCSPSTPTVAAVFTGSAMRVKEGFNLLKSGAVDKLFISGVGTKLAPIPLAEKFNVTLTQDEETRVTLDRLADNTRSNATNTAAWVKNLSACRLVLVTSDDHMDRAAYLLSAALKQNGISHLPLYAHAVADPEHPARNLLKTVEEKLKLTALQLGIWPAPKTGMAIRPADVLRHPDAPAPNPRN